MPLPPLLPSNLEEIEIDRLLLELGIELPAVESIASTALPAGVNGEPPSNPDDAESPQEQEEEEAVIFCLPLPLARRISWPPETES